MADDSIEKRDFCRTAAAAAACMKSFKWKKFLNAPSYSKDGGSPFLELAEYSSDSDDRQGGIHLFLANISSIIPFVNNVLLLFIK